MYQTIIFLNVFLKSYCILLFAIQFSNFDVAYSNSSKIQNYNYSL